MAGEWWQSHYSREAASILEAFNETPKLAVKVNTLKTNRDGLRKMMEEKGIKTETVPWDDNALILWKEPMHSGPWQKKALLMCSPFPP